MIRGSCLKKVKWMVDNSRELSLHIRLNLKIF